MTMTTEPTPTVRIRPGVPYPLGATWDKGGTNFALYSENASKVELCLYDDQGTETRHSQIGRASCRERVCSTV